MEKLFKHLGYVIENKNMLILPLIFSVVGACIFYIINPIIKTHPQDAPIFEVVTGMVGVFYSFMAIKQLIIGGKIKKSTHTILFFSSIEMVTYLTMFPFQGARTGMFMTASVIFLFVLTWEIATEEEEDIMEKEMD